MILTGALAGIVFWLAFDGGTYSVQSRNVLAIAVWWAVILGAGLGIWPRSRVPAPAIVTGSFLFAFMTWTAASIAWSASAERAFTEFNRAALYLGVFVLVVLAARRANLGACLDACGIGIAAVGTLALTSRLFPGVFPSETVGEILPATATRLSYPLGYWNGLAILVALALPLLVRTAVVASTPARRGAALAPIPALATGIFLTSSRGGVAVAALALALLVALTGRRWAVAGAVVTAVAGSVAAVAILLPRSELVNGPIDSAAAASQGRVAALLILLVAIVTGAIWAVASEYAPRYVRPRAVHGYALAGVAILVLAVGIVLADPIQHFQTFKEPLAAQAERPPNFVQSHLLSGNGSGRWQFWTAATNEFTGNPVLGNGAGSYEAWWAETGTISIFVRDAHSLYLETLGELGVVGLILLLGFIVAGLVEAGRRLLRTRDEERLAVAALTVTFVGYLLGAGIDWMWELTVVSIVAVGTLGLLTSSATAAVEEPRLIVTAERDRRTRARFALGATFVLAGWIIVCSQAIPLLASAKIADSQAAARNGKGEEAIGDAVAAKKIQPWAASPYLQIALLEEQAGNVGVARSAIANALERDPRNWRLWLVSARIETKAGNIAEARERLARAAELNPRSPLFTSS